MAIVDTGVPNLSNEFLVNIKDLIDSNLGDLAFDSQTVQIVEIGLPSTIPQAPSIYITDVGAIESRDGAALLYTMEAMLQCYVKYSHRTFGTTGAMKFRDKIGHLYR